MEGVPVEDGFLDIVERRHGNDGGLLFLRFCGKEKIFDM